MTDHHVCVQLFMYEFQMITLRKTLNGMLLPVRGVKMMKDQKQAITLLLVQAKLTGLHVRAVGVTDRDTHCLCESLFGMYIRLTVHTYIYYVHTFVHTYIHTNTYIYTYINTYIQTYIYAYIHEYINK